MLQIVKARPNWPVYADVFEHPPHGFHLDTQYGHVSMPVCLSVCMSVTSRYCIETAEWIELVFGTHASIDLSYAVF